MADENDDILYQFPEFYGNSWIYSEIDSIGFQDLNNDSYKDIIIIEWVTAPAGIQEEFPIVGVYFQKEKEFINQPELDKKINDEYQNENIDMIAEYVKKMDIKLD